MKKNIIFINARIFDGLKFIKEDCLIIENQKIHSVRLSGKNLFFPKNSRVIDLKQKILSPGLIDIHTHGAMGIDCMNASGDNLKIMENAMAKTGVTSYVAASFCDVSSMSKNEVTNNSKNGYSKCLGKYIEGPFINSEKKGMISDKFIWKKLSGAVSKLKEILNHNKSLRIMTIAPETPGFIEIINQLIKANIIASFGHSAAGYDETKIAIQSGIKHVTHLFNAMEVFHHRNPGPIPAIAESVEVTAELIADGIHVLPAAVRTAISLLGKNRIILISDSAFVAGLEDGIYETADRRNVIVKDKAAFLGDKTLIGSCTSLLDMVKNVKKWCGLSNEESLKMATYNPSKLLGFPKVGIIKPGYFADLIVLDSKLNLFEVLINGKSIMRLQEKI